MTQIRRTLAPAQTALLLMDFQPFKLAHLPGSEDLLKRTLEVVDAARVKGVQVAHVWSAFSDLDYATVPDSNRRLLPAVQQRLLHVDEPASAIHASLAPRDGDIVERKTRVGAFATTKLDEQLTNLGIINLLLAGVFTSSTVLSTVLDAADRDYQLFVLGDCIGDPEPEVHDLLLRKVLPTQAKIVSAADFDDLIRAG